jgi:hypothetical protein
VYEGERWDSEARSHYIENWRKVNLPREICPQDQFIRDLVQAAATKPVRGHALPVADPRLAPSGLPNTRGVPWRKHVRTRVRCGMQQIGDGLRVCCTSGQPYFGEQGSAGPSATAAIF